jgi:orotidine-5'-phosphate decarboxylase
MAFSEKLRNTVEKNDSLLCVGLDPDPARLPAGMTISEFNREIVDATRDVVCAYKPNLAFYEAEGLAGLKSLEETLSHIPSGIPVIGDAKRGDIGNTARMYAHSMFDVFGFDAATVSPYLGFDSVEPFTSYADRHTFLLCRTSNRSAKDFQDLEADGRPVYEHVALKALEWNTGGNIGLVVGATYPQELERIRQLCPSMCLLVPGVGSQGGDLEQVVSKGSDSDGAGAIINVSRAVLYASTEADFAQAARTAASALRDDINRHRRPTR